MDGQTVQQCYSGCKIMMCKSSLLAPECRKLHNRASSSGITSRQHTILHILGAEDAKESISKTYGEMDQADYLTEEIGPNK